MFHDCPGDGNAVVGGCTSSQLVEKHERARRDVVHDAGGFVHFDHERTFAGGDVVRGTDTRENLIDQTDAGRGCGHKGAHLRHEGDERGLTKQRTLTCHVRTGDNHDLLRFGVEFQTVAHIFLSGRHEGLNDGVATFADVNDGAVVHHGTHVVSFARNLCQRIEAVETADGDGVVLQFFDFARHLFDEVVEKNLLEGDDFVFRAENFGFIFFQLFGDVAFRLRKRLFSHPFLRHLVFIGVAHFDVVSENVVEPNL